MKIPPIYAQQKDSNLSTENCLSNELLKLTINKTKTENIKNST